MLTAHQRKNMPVDLLPDARGLGRVELDVLARDELRRGVDLVVREGDVVRRELGDDDVGRSVLDVRLLVLRSCSSPRARSRLLAELRELADDDGARVDPHEDAEEDESVDEQIQDRAAVARDVAKGR